MQEIACENCGTAEELWEEEAFTHLRSCIECQWAKFECDNCGNEVSVVL